MTKHEAGVAALCRRDVGPASGTAAARRPVHDPPDDPVRLEPLISAALLTTTAFRLRDRDALEDALRLLACATRAFEEPATADL